LFGGYSYPGYLQDTWEWNGSAWTRNFTAHTPPPRDWSAMSYDSKRHVMVLFGGLGAGSTLLNDTWEYDGTDWKQVTLAAAPPIRIWHSMAYDAALDGVVVFGGVEGTNASYNDTWIYDGTSWQQINSPNRPIARFWASMAYDSAHGELVLFGGGQDTLSNVLGDTWLLSGINTLPVNWAQSQTSTTPAARAWPAMDYDSARGVTVMFGGSTGG